MKLSKPLIILIVILTSVCTFFVTKYIDDRVTEKRFTRERHNYEIATYFGEICVGAEYEWITPVTHKFKKKATLFVVKDSTYKEQIEFISKSLSEFNKLPMDGFSITMTNDSSSADILLYLSQNNRLPKIKNLGADSIFGQFNSDIEKFYITKARVFINTSKPLNSQKTAILEEIIQCTGFFRDSDFYLNSTFFQYKYQLMKDVHSLSKEDKAIISLLYHPKMKAGLNKKRAMELCMEILNL